MVRYIVKLIQVLHSDTDPSQIALGFSLGMVLGLTPLVTPYNAVVLLAILFFRVNISAAIISWALFSLLSFVLDPLFNFLGIFVLMKIHALEGLWTALYNVPLIPYTRFNNSIIMGSLLFSLVMFYPVFRGGEFMVVEYRDIFMARIEHWKVKKVIKTSRLYKCYAQYSELRG